MFAFEMKENYCVAAAVNKLAAKGIHAGTQVTRRLLNNLQCPDKKLKIIHIAGTNGKGSTAEFFTRILIAAGKKCGTFTSPEVYDFYDQFRIDGAAVPPEKMEVYFEKALKAAEGLDATAFEVQTAAIIYAFACEGCEYAVIECGMGGLNDATNAVESKRLAVITSVSLEHTAYLGNTLSEICAQKAGIIKNCPAVANAAQPPEAKEFLRAAGVKFADGVKCVGAKQFAYGGKTYALSAEGELQPYNAATAIEGAKILGIDEGAVYEGVKSARPCGRIERFNRLNANYILDGAHNPAAFAPLASHLKSLPANEVTLIFGCLKDKDMDGILKQLAGVAKNITAVPCLSPRARSLEETAAACRKYFGNVQKAQNVKDALEAAKTKTVVVCGSFTILKEAKQWLENLTEKRQ